MVNKKTKYAGPSIRKELRAESVSLPKKSWYEKVAWPFIILLCIVMFFTLDYGSDYKRREGALTFDESIYMRLGFQLKNGEPYNTLKLFEERHQSILLPSYMSRPVFKHPPLFSWLISMSYSVLEQKSAYQFEELYGAASKVPNLMGCLLVLLAFMFAKKRYGYAAAILAALLLAIDLNVTLSSQKVWMESTLAFFVFSTLHLLYKSCEENKGYFYPAGIVFGFALLTKYTAVLIAPILISYILIYHRAFFRQKELYLFFAIAALIFSPWVIHNINVYGLDTFKVMILGQTAGPIKMAYFAAFTGAAIFILLIAIKMNKQRESKMENEFNNDQSFYGMRQACMIVIGLFSAFLLTQKPFLMSIIKTLDWSSLPTAGWDMKLFKQEPRYFYLKQQIEYSPIYLFLLIAFLRAPFGQKQDVFLFLSCFWMLLFTTVWGNFQGRYVLSFVAPAIILISSTIILTFQFLMKQKNMTRYVGLGFMLLSMTYFIVKALKVYQAIALSDNVAYF
ncbi:MAG: glycosyltransferase family 39 protein [Candidatus Omnitrophica bacterium]|nr:glycosyltransferase family 39 protein [Candidatus Omnitrophota bacterium]